MGVGMDGDKSDGKQITIPGTKLRVETLEAPP